jgi:hypothetical protein
MNSEKFTLVSNENETIFKFNLAENDNIIFHKKLKCNLLQGDKLCTIESGLNKAKLAVNSPVYGQLSQLLEVNSRNPQAVITNCQHEIEFSGMCGDCGADMRYLNY